MIIQATQIRVGMIIKHNSGLFRVAGVEHVTPGNWRGMVQAKLKNLATGSGLEHRFRSEDKVERAELDEHEMEFLYASGDEHTFMNSKTFEQITLPKEILGDGIFYLIPNLKVMVEFHEGNAVSVEFPITVDLAVTETEPGLKGATITNVMKAAVLETGLKVQVPQFIGAGDVVRVDTRDGHYIERVRSA